MLIYFKKILFDNIFIIYNIKYFLYANFNSLTNIYDEILSYENFIIGWLLTYERGCSSRFDTVHLDIVGPVENRYNI